MFKKLIEKDNKNYAEMLNYPSKGIYGVLILIILLSGFLYIPIYSFFSLSSSRSLSETILVEIITIGIILIMIFVFNFTIVRSIKFYENKYGKTGLGDKYLEKIKKE